MENQIQGIQAILAHNIKDARKKLGYSQQELAERAQLSPGHMNDLEQGRKWVSADTLQRLADALLLEPWMLLSEESSGASFERHEVITKFASKLRAELPAQLSRLTEEFLRD